MVVIEKKRVANFTSRRKLLNRNNSKFKNSKAFIRYITPLMALINIGIFWTLGFKEPHGAEKLCIANSLALSNMGLVI
jgi:hypothetical protein